MHMRHCQMQRNARFTTRWEAGALHSNTAAACLTSARAAERAAAAVQPDVLQLIHKKMNVCAVLIHLRGC
jgi:hypothetical protein